MKTAVLFYRYIVCIMIDILLVYKMYLSFPVMYCQSYQIYSFDDSKGSSGGVGGRMGEGLEL